MVSNPYPTLVLVPVMDVDASTVPSQSYTILRIKRKRNEEPLDALGHYAFQFPALELILKHFSDRERSPSKKNT